MAKDHSAAERSALAGTARRNQRPEPSWRQRQHWSSAAPHSGQVPARRAGSARTASLASPPDQSRHRAPVPPQPAQLPIIAGNRYREPGDRTVRFARKDHVVEGTHQPARPADSASGADAVAFHPSAMAPSRSSTALPASSTILPAVICNPSRSAAGRRKAGDNTRSPRNGLIDGAGLCKRAKALDQLFQFLRMT